MIAALNGRSVRRKLSLHYYQTESIERINASWEEGLRRAMCVLPTGSGKSALAGELIAQNWEKGERSIMCVHTRKLAFQFAQATEKNFGVWSTVEAGTTKSEDSPLVCCTVQSLVNRIESGAIDPLDYSLMVIDEGHRSWSPTHQKILKAFEHARLLLITATPRRSDQKDLMKLVDVKAADVPLNELIDNGYLSPLQIKNMPIEIKLEASKKSGDYTEQDCAHAIEPYLESIADCYVKEAVGRCGCIFAPLISTSKKFVDMLKVRGVKAAHVDGEMEEDEINDILEDLEMGRIETVSCSMLLAEGWDCRPVNILLSLRPTKSWGLYVQQVGRATRTFDPDRDGPEGTRWPKKTEAILLDPLYLCDDHSLLQRPSVLLAADEEEAKAIDVKLKKSGGGSLMEAVKAAKNDREERLRQKLEAASKRQARTVSAMEFFSMVNLPDWAEYQPLNSFEEKPVSALTPKQHDWLVRSKFQMESIQNMGQARKILDVLGDRAKKGLCTLAQFKYCEGLGMPDAFNASFNDASKWIEDHAPSRPWQKYKR